MIYPINITETGRNTYIEDMDFSKGAATVELKNNEKLILAFEISEVLSEYDFSQKFCIHRDIEEKVTGQLLKTDLNTEDANKALKEVYYWTRKILKAEAEKEESPSPAEEVPAEDYPTEKPKKQKKSKSTSTMGIEQQILEIAKEAIQSPESTEIMVATVKEKLDNWGIVPGKLEVHVIKPEGEVKIVGHQHKKFPIILKALSAKCNVALVGPAGSGKTTAVRVAAESLELPFYSKSVSAQTGIHEFFGYQDANGNYIRTIFREAYENGGIFLLDEFDAGNPNVLAALNQATANSVCAFADGMIDKHDDFMCVMAGNTFGHGATSEYVGRNKIDAATLDRFVFIQFGYDEEFEYQIAPNKTWCKKIQDIRKKVANKKIKTIVSPRATFDGAKLLSVGLDEKEVLELTVYKGLNEDERRLLIN